MSEAVVVEFEGFQLLPHAFIVKELAVVNRAGLRFRRTFLPPYPWAELCSKRKKTYDWLIQNFHGLTWESGDLPYTSLRPILEVVFSLYSDIYVKEGKKLSFYRNLQDDTSGT